MKKLVSSATDASLAILSRDEYGALTQTPLSETQNAEVKALLAKARKNGVPYDYTSGTGFKDKEFECRNTDIFDVLVVRGKVRGLVLQSRWFWKNKKKGYTRLAKEYYVVTTKYSSVTVKELEDGDKGTCMKRAKNSNKLGQLHAHYVGGKVLKCVGR